MKSITSLFEDGLRKTYEEAVNAKPKHKISFSYQELGIEMETELKTKQVWPLFHNVKYTEGMIRQAFLDYKRGKVKNFRYFMAILRNKAKK